MPRPEARSAPIPSSVVNGSPGLVWAQGGRPTVVFDFTITGGRIVGIDLVADPDRLSQLELTGLEG